MSRAGCATGLMVIFMLTLFTGACAAADPAATLRSAEKAYTHADYRNAITLYEQAMHDGASAPEVWYNLGNAYFKNGDLAESILWYERAYLHEPGDAQLRDNLAIANARIRDRVEPMPLLFAVRWWNDLKTTHSAGTLFAWSCLCAWLLAGAAFLFFGMHGVMVRRISLALGTVFFACTIAAAILYFDKREDLEAHRFAIVMQRAVTARSTPDATGVESFAIHEGLKVEITEKRASWLRIRLADGKDGWVDAGAVTPI
jgi:tetratricopeptide (TPR) repeat protein